MEMQVQTRRRLIGEAIDRVDGPLKVSGLAKYTADTAVDDLTYGALTLSSIGNGRIRSIDTRAAQASAGVVSVITHENALRLETGIHGLPFLDKNLLALQDDIIRQPGQVVALVVAESLEEAEFASTLIKIEYERSPIVASLEDATSYRPASPGPYTMVWQAGDPDQVRGDVKAGFAAAHERLDLVYKTAITHHNPMELHATTAQWDGACLVLYDSNQGIFEVQRKLAVAFGIPQSNVRVITPFVGGAFGSKSCVGPHTLLAAMAAKMVGRPVKIVLRRADVFSHTGFRPRTIQEISIGADAEGHLTAISHHTQNQTSSFDEWVEPCGAFTRVLYACPNLEITHRLAEVSAGTPTWMRAPGEAPGSFALECAMDELACELGVDPLEFRLRNYAEVDPADGRPWSSKSLKECYLRGAEAFDWSRRRPTPGATSDGPWLIGYGMATASYPAWCLPASALARVYADGSASVASGSQDLGTGACTVFTQVAADALDLSLERVRFSLGDTELPWAPVSGGSMTTASVGSAVHLACRDLRRKLIGLAVNDPNSPIHGAAIEDVVVKDGSMSLPSDAKARDTYAGVLQRHFMSDMESRIDASPGEEAAKYSMHSFGAQFCEVGVDRELKLIRVRRWVGAFAGGRILNEKTARSQMIGGIVGGIGMALLEASVVDERNARYVTASLADYAVPVHADMPSHFDVIMVEEEDRYVNPIGVKGVGEIGAVGVAAAIANAIYSATGQRIREVPILSATLL